MSNLDRTWKNCLRMWKWISENWNPGRSVEIMKRRWLKDHRFKNAPISHCFFCQHNAFHADCSDCPGRLVSKRFHCENVSYDYYNRPKRFYAKLLELDAKRKQA